MKRSALMYCSCSGERCGSLRRTVAVASRLSDSFDVTVLLGESASGRVPFPDNVRTVLLPTLGIDPDTNVIDIHRSQEHRDCIVARRNILVREFERLKPRVVAVEDFPFRQQSQRGELLPVIERARNGVYGDTLVVGMTDGILAGNGARHEAAWDETLRMLDKYFDMVVVHTDPVFARIEEIFQPRSVVPLPVYHTGFVTWDEGSVQGDSGIAPGTVVVSAGDGVHGGPLYRAAVEAYKILGATLLLPMKIIAGERFPEDEWLNLVQLAQAQPDLSVVRRVPNMAAVLAHARLSVSQCEYSTAVRTMQARTPALFVPTGHGDREAQIIRAQRLVYWGAGRLLLPQHLNGASLANEIHELMRFQPRRMHFDMNGASNAANLISQAAYHNDIAAEAVRPDANGHRPH